MANSGTVPVTISQITAAGSGFGIGGVSLPLTLGVGNSVTFTASFTPVTTGSTSGTVSIASSQLSSPMSIPMTGTGMGTSPAITSQPTSQAVLVGQTATFSVTASGTIPLNYQWRKNGVPIGGAISATYTTPSEVISDNGSQFTVVVSDSAGSVTSNAAILAVTASPVAPSITTQPVSQTITAGQTATFSVSASGTAPLSYQWRKSGTAINGATGSSYTTPTESTSDNGAQFTVVVGNSAGTVTSNASTLTVNPAPVAPSITTQPASQTITAGQTATFSVSASGTAPLSYQWRKSGTAINGATGSSYTTPAETTADSGAQFIVVITNSGGTVTSSAAVLTVNATPVAPSISTQPAGQTVAAGQTATFSVVASGTTPLAYQWQRNGTAIGGATSSSYTTPPTSSSDNGAQFTVTVINSVGSMASNVANLTVNIPPLVTTQPTSQTVLVGQTITFSVNATGTAPLTYQWKKNGTSINGATSSTYTTPAVTASDNGAQFTVAVANAAGTVTSNAAILTVNAPPAITSQPANQSVIVGQTASFSVTATGTAPLSYQWQKNGTAIGGATSPVYTTPSTSSSDNGAQFTVTVSNSFGSVNSSAGTLTVNALGQLSPTASSLNFGNVIVGSSSAQAVTITNSGGSNATISNVSVIGAGFSASGISAGQILSPGTSATLNVTFAPAASGNITGSVTLTSNASNATLTISLSAIVAADTTPPTVSITAPVGGSTVSGTFTVTASASDPDSPVAFVQFLLDGANLGSQLTASPYSFSWNTTAVANGAHTLTAISQDPAGNQGTSAAVTVTVSNSTSTGATGPLRPLASNPNYFTDGSGKAILLTGSHTWTDFQDLGQSNSPVATDFNAYVSFLQAHGHNVTILWKKDLPQFCNWGAGGTWTIASSTGMPWLRPGPGTATDGYAKFDLTQLNQTYFDRLRARVIQLQQAGIYAIVELFDGYQLTSNRCSTDGYPFTGANNINGIDDGGGTGSMTMTAPDTITSYQEAFVKKVVDTLNDQPNVIWEISEEAPDNSTWWQGFVIDLLHSYEGGGTLSETGEVFTAKPNKHPVDFPTLNVSGASDSTLYNSNADLVSPVARISPPTSCGTGTPACKVNVNDSDHSYFGMWNDSAQTNRNYVWENFTSGDSVIFMDPYLIYWSSGNRNLCQSPVNGVCSGVDTRWDNLRNNLGYTLTYANKMDLAKMTAQASLSSTGYCLAQTPTTGAEYLVYAPNGGSFTVDLRAMVSSRTLKVEWFDPSVGATTSGGTVSAGSVQSFTPPFSGDAVLYLVDSAGHN